MRFFPAVTLFAGIAGVAGAPVKCKSKPASSVAAPASSAPPLGSVSDAVPTGTAVPIPIPSVEPIAASAPVSAAGSEASGNDTLEANVALASASGSGIVPAAGTTPTASLLASAVASSAPVADTSSSPSSPSSSNTTASSNTTTSSNTTANRPSGSGPLWDTTQTIVDRKKALESMSDADIFAEIGEPVLTGDSQYHSLMRVAIANTTRLSVMHAQQMRDVMSWKVPISTVTNEDASMYIGGELQFLHDMIKDTSETVIAHEAGHAVFDHHGFKNATAKAIADAGLDEGYGEVAGLINEAFSTLFAQRAGLFNHPDWYNSTTWNKEVAHTTEPALTWILGGKDGTTQAWHQTLSLNKATQDRKADIVRIADSIIFPRLAELYAMDQPRGEVPAYLDEE